MNQRDEEAVKLIDNQKFEDAVNQTKEQAEALLKETEEKYGKITGSAPHNALIVLGLQFFLASICTLLVTEIPPLLWIFSKLPVMNVINFLIYAIVLAAIQFGTKFTQKTPWNFFMFLVQSGVKIVYLVFYGAQYNLQKFEIFYFLLLLPIVYVFLRVKDQEVNKDANLTVKGNLVKLSFFTLVIGVYICLLANTGFGPVSWIPVTAAAYGVYLLLVIQRFHQFEYLQSGYNSIFLGAGQIEADMLFFCGLLVFHFKNKTPEVPEPQKEQRKGEFAPTPKRTPKREIMASPEVAKQQNDQPEVINLEASAQEKKLDLV